MKLVIIQAGEDAADVLRLRESEARVAAGTDEYMPAEVTRRLMAGEVPVRVWRQYRGLSTHTLAARAGLSPSHLSQNETGKKPGSFAAMAKLARALDVELSDLEVWSE